MATITDTFSALGTITITATSLANSTAGVGRVSAYLDNTSTKYLSANVYCKLTTGTAATANTPIYIYLMRGDNVSINEDGNGTADAAGTVINAPLLGVLNVVTTTASLPYYGVFDTSSLGPLGPAWGVAIVNSSGHPLNGTAAQHLITYIGVTKTVA
jgi:hypothetical protein